MKILNFGSLNIDYVYDVEHFVKKGETISSDSLHIFSGGKGLNQSVALAKAGAEVYHAGVIGEDGSFLIDVLRTAGVDTNYILMQKDLRTGSAIIQRDSSGDNCIILFGGANQGVNQVYVDQVMEHFDKGDFIVLQNEINGMKYIMEKAHEKGMIIILNPSPMNEKIWELPLEYVDYFLVNEVEAAQLSGLEQENEDELLNHLVQKFPHANIVMTLGEHGSVYYDGKQVLHQEAVKAKAVDTTAAGDTYTGYFVAGLMQNMDIRSILKISATASAIAVTRQGAAPSIPSADEVKEKIKTSKL